MKIKRHIGLGFFLIFCLVASGCASTKSQGATKPPTPGAQTGPGADTSAPSATERVSPTPAPKAAAASSQPQPGVSEPPTSQPKESRLRPSVSRPSASSQMLPAAEPAQSALPAPSMPGIPNGQKFVLNFDNADLYEVIRVMSQMMKMNYLIDPRVKGVVNIHTSGQISQAEIFPIFQSILKLNGAAAVQRGNVYEVVPFPEAKKLAIQPLLSKDSGKGLPDEKYAIQIILIKYIPVTEVSKIIKPFLSDGADIVEHPTQNILIIGDIASNIRKALDIIDLFDADIFTDQSVRVYPISKSNVNEIAKEMERIFASLEVSLKSGRGVGITFTPLTRINSLLVVSSIPQIFEKVEAWLKELDRIPAEASKVSAFVYYVQNGKAKDLADVLKQVYASSPYMSTTGMTATTQAQRTSTPTTTPTSPITPTSPTSTMTPYPTTPGVGVPGAAAYGSSIGSLTEGNINIVVDETTNALIIRAFPRDYEAVLETIKKLDLYPKQALLEVFLAEVALDETTKYGLEFSTFQDSFVRGIHTYNYSIGMGGIPPVDPTTNPFTSGIRYAISATDKLAAAIQASASNNRLKTLSSPHILASNNKEAKIQIGSSEPILTTTYTTPGLSAAATTPGTGGTTVSSGIVTGTIEYKDIGIILSVTPRISDQKLVTLDVQIEQSTVSSKPLGTLPNVPFFPKKTAKTTLSVLEGQTIVIGGLIDETKNTSMSGVPWFYKLPVIGWLFGSRSFQETSTETILLLTPHVITDLDESNQVTREFREKVGGVKREMEKMQREKEKRMWEPGVINR
jgi:general secretion pathway protein D